MIYGYMLFRFQWKRHYLWNNSHWFRMWYRWWMTSTERFPYIKRIINTHHVFESLSYILCILGIRHQIKLCPMHCILCSISSYPLGKMAAISETFSDVFLWFYILIGISMKYVPEEPIDNTSGFVQAMAWWRASDKPFLEPILTQFTDAYLRH